VSDEDSAGGGLRIGLWLPPSEEPQTPGERVRAALRAAEGGSIVDPVEKPSRARRFLLGAVAVTALLLPVSLITAQVGGDDPAPAGWPQAGGPAAPAAPTPSAETGEPPSPSGSPGTPSGPVGGAGAKPTAKPTGTSARPLVPVGARIGLEPVAAPGFRVRHRNFVGRIDAIGPNSRRTDRADSSFVVRAGLADQRCVSFEAVNFPGFFLRHQDFVILLRRNDSTALFAADATFCPVPGLSGQQVSLRSLNFPDRFLVHRGFRLTIEPADRYATTRAAMTFAVRDALLS
jgi:hypothetical protein